MAAVIGLVNRRPTQLLDRLSVDRRLTPGEGIEVVARQPLLVGSRLPSRGQAAWYESSSRSRSLTCRAMKSVRWLYVGSSMVIRVLTAVQVA